jgi:hypothetical protein
LAAVRRRHASRSSRSSSLSRRHPSCNGRGTRRPGRRSRRRTASAGCRHLRRRACQDCSRSKLDRYRRHVGCRWRSHNPRTCSDAQLPIACARRSQPMRRPRWLARAAAVRLAAMSLWTRHVSTHRTAGRPYLVPSTSIADDAHVRHDNPTQPRISRSAMVPNEILPPNVREFARARLVVI